MASSYTPTTNFLMSHAQAAMTNANNAESRIAGLQKPSLRSPQFSFEVNKPPLQPPPSFSDLFPSGGSEDATLAWLNEQAEAWLQQYFPNITACLKTLPDDWLCDVISGVKPLGYSQTYFELAWHSARDRAERTRASEVQTMKQEFSALGFSLPPGALVSATDQAQQRASDVVLEVNREQAMKDVEIKHQMLMFAEEQALRYKTNIMQLMANFYQQWSTLPDKDIERAKIRAQAMAAFYGALSSYYNVELGFEELRLRAETADAGVDIDVDRNKITMFGADNTANSALGQAVRGFSDISAAAANAAGTLVAQIESV